MLYQFPASCRQRRIIFQKWLVQEQILQEAGLDLYLLPLSRPLPLRHSNMPKKTESTTILEPFFTAADHALLNQNLQRYKDLASLHGPEKKDARKQVLNAVQEILKASHPDMRKAEWDILKTVRRYFFTGYPVLHDIVRKRKHGLISMVASGSLAHRTLKNPNGTSTGWLGTSRRMKWLEQ